MLKFFSLLSLAVPTLLFVSPQALSEGSYDGFQRVAIFLVGGFGIFYGLSSASAPWYVTWLAVVAWAALFIWLWLVNRPSQDR